LADNGVKAAGLSLLSSLVTSNKLSPSAELPPLGVHSIDKLSGLSEDLSLPWGVELLILETSIRGV